MKLMIINIGLLLKGNMLKCGITRKIRPQQHIVLGKLINIKVWFEKLFNNTRQEIMTITKNGHPFYSLHI